MAEAEKKLTWPPAKDDLERLYVHEHLSAMKIATVYGLKYPSPKTAESTVLHHLKKNGIGRRDCAEHIRKVTTAMVDEWVVRYQAGESLKQIAGGEVSPVTVFNQLNKRGLQLRDKVEAQIKAVTKHKRTPFAGDMEEKAYLVGLTIGDFYVQRHGKAIRVRVGTTHPKMARLFRDLFSSYGPVYEYPKENTVTGYEWCLDCDLDESFRFLLNREEIVDMAFQDDSLFLCFLAGFFDAEGSIYFHKKKVHGAFEFSLTNMNETLLRRIVGKLSELGYPSKLSRKRQYPEKALQRGIKNSSDFIWHVAIWRYEEVVRLIRALPSRHQERVAKIGIALRLGFRSGSKDREAVISDWEFLKASIKKECLEYIDLARETFETRRECGKNTKNSLNYSPNRKRSPNITYPHELANNSIPNIRAGCLRCGCPSRGEEGHACS